MVFYFQTQFCLAAQAFNCDHPASLPKSRAYLHVLLSAAPFQSCKPVSLSFISND